MYYCYKCKKEISSKKEMYHGHCADCYIEILYDKIEHLDDPNYKIDLPKEHKFIDFIKQIFKK